MTFLNFDFLYLIGVVWMAMGLAYTNSWHWRERDAHDAGESSQANTKWHRWQYWAVLAPVFVIFGLLAMVNISIYMVLLSIPVWWIIFDGVAAKRLGKKWFYVGQTSTIDKLLMSPAFKFVLLGIGLALYVLGILNLI